MIVVTRIPTHHNDGTKFSLRELRALLSRVRAVFGGYSLEGPFEGSWVGGNGDVYDEKSYKLEIVVTRAEVKIARRLCIDIGKRLGQRAIYLEVREGGEIIDIQ